MNAAPDEGGALGRFNAVLSQAPIGAVLVSSHGEVLGANKAFLTLVDAPSIASVMSFTLQSAGLYKNSQVRRQIARLIDGTATEANFEAEWRSNWGKQVVAQVNVTKIVDSNNDQLFQVFFTDRSVGPAESANKLWKSMLDTSTNEFHVIDRESQKFVFVSQRAIKELGYTLTEFQSMTPADICPVSTQKQIHQTFFEPLNDGTTERVSRIGHYQRKDGSTYLVNMVVQSTVFRGMAAYLIIAQDISDSIATHAALEQAELFLSSAPDPTVIVDSAGIIAFASDQTESLLGYRRSDLVGMAIKQFWPQSTSQLKQMHSAASALQSDALANNAVSEFIHRDGSIIPVETTLSRIETSDSVLVAIGCRNVSGRLATEDALNAAKEAAEHAMVTKSHLLAAASHDLRQPTQSLSQYSWLMRQAATTPEQIDLATNIQASVDSIANLLNAFLDISKLDSGVTQANVMDYDIQSLCPPIMSNYGPVARAAGIDLQCRCESNFVRSDPVLVQRVIENLVSNAIRYTRQGYVRVFCNLTPKGLVVTVSDTGIGIESDQIERIFDEHYQIASARSADRKGLGLGLSIVQRISKLLDLPIAVSSLPGVGSEFSITLDYVGKRPTSPIQGPQTEVVSDRTSATQVLLIDDELAVLKSTKMVLERHQCTVHTADTAEIAMQKLQSGIRPDILVTDYRLPGDSGTELVHNAREVLGHNIPAVIITGDMSGDAINIDHLPAVKVLHKPTSLKRLVSTIVQLAN